MMILNSPEEKMVIELTGSTVGASVYLGYSEKFADASKYGNTHLILPSDGQYVALTGAIHQGTQRIMIGVSVYNPGAATLYVRIRLANEVDIPIVSEMVAPGAALVYADGSGWQTFPSTITAAPGSTLMFGADNVVATADTRFLFPGYANQQASANSFGILAPRAGKLKNLFVRHNAGVGNGNSVVYKVRVNGVDTQLTCTVPTSVVGNGFDTAHTVQVEQGQLIEVSALKATSIGNGSVQVIATIQYVD